MEYKKLKLFHAHKWPFTKDKFDELLSCIYKLDSLDKQVYVVLSFCTAGTGTKKEIKMLILPHAAFFRWAHGLFATEGADEGTMVCAKALFYEGDNELAKKLARFLATPLPPESGADDPPWIKREVCFNLKKVALYYFDTLRKLKNIVKKHADKPAPTDKEIDDYIAWMRGLIQAP